MTINFKTPEIKELKPRILVLGVGGAGGNAINKMIESGLQGVEFVAVNTDAQDLIHSKAKAKIQIGLNLTKGLGAGSKIDIGHAAAEESLNEIVNCLQGANMVFVTAGMGGGTGTGSAHVIARAAKELNILTVGVVTLPFLYEGSSKMRRAQQGLEELRKHVDTIIVVPNQNLFKIANEQTGFEEAFELSNDVLLQGVQSVTDLMVRPGLVNLDYADVETIMSSMGKAMMGTGEAEGEGRALKAAEQAMTNPLIDDYSLKSAKGLLINITAKNPTLFEVDDVVKKITSEVDAEVEFIKGCIIDPSLEEKFRVSIVATSLDGQQPESKSIINMVHRIQNRNPGYSDFSNMKPNYSFEMNKGLSTSGANALKIETNDIKVSENDLISSMVDEKMAVENPITNESENEDNSLEEKLVLSDNDVNTSDDESNGLENFNLDTQDPQLFDESQSINSDHETNINEDRDTDEEDELEIPAFLRRQKN